MGAEIRYAARRGDLVSVDIELASGASLEDPDSPTKGLWKSWTALTHAAESKSCSDEAFAGLVERAVRTGVSMTTPAIASALSLAGRAGRIAKVRSQLDCGARVDNRDSSDKTALHRALQLEEAAIAQLLLDRGADPNIMDLDGYRALDYCESKFLRRLVAGAGGVEGPKCW